EEKKEKKEGPVAEKPAAKEGKPSQVIPRRDYLHYSVRAGVMFPNAKFFDPILDRDVTSGPAFAYGIEHVQRNTPRERIVARLLYGTSNVDSDPEHPVSGAFQFFQFSVNMLYSADGTFMSPALDYYGFGAGYTRMGASVTCLDPAGCGRIGNGGVSSPRENHLGFNLIGGVSTGTGFNLEAQYTLTAGDFYMTLDYPLR
ncbi:MAG: hypothetical protein AB1742_01815, partial [bacterium]